MIIKNNTVTFDKNTLCGENVILYKILSLFILKYKKFTVFKIERLFKIA